MVFYEQTTGGTGVIQQIRCWEYKKCERQPGGSQVGHLGVCPASLSPDQQCWLVAGTMCGDTIEGTFALKYETCIVCDYYNKTQDHLSKRPRTGFYLFGQYLCRQGLATDEQVIEARSLQLQHNRKIGDLARAKNMLTDEQIQRILIIQEEKREKFGTLCLDLGFLNKTQLKELLLEQEDNYLFFGEALVQLGILTESEMFAQLKAFNTMKLQKQRK